MASLGRKGSAGRPRPHMNVTPLVDVVLVLLIIFMIVIPAMEESLDLEVPAATQADEEGDEEGPEPVMLAVSRAGHVYLQERRVPEGQLTAQLEAEHIRAPSRPLVLRGDRGVRYARIRELFAAAQAVGFPGISLRINHAEPTGDDAEELASAGGR